MIDDVSEVLPNASAPMDVTLVGILIDTSDVHDMKALSPIVVMLVGILIDVSDVHDEKAYSPIEVKWFGMVSSPVGHENQAAYDITDDGMIDDVSEVLPNASAPMDVTLVGGNR
jgi:hypothetical protein